MGKVLIPDADITPMALMKMTVCAPRVEIAFKPSNGVMRGRDAVSAILNEGPGEFVLYWSREDSATDDLMHFKIYYTDPAAEVFLNDRFEVISSRAAIPEPPHQPAPEWMFKLK